MGILICGLNGAGKSTLGKALADRMGYEFIDNEDLFFPKADPAYAYSAARNKDEVIKLLEERVRKNDHFIFSAVKGDYGELFTNSLKHIILVDVPKQVRSQRVRNRSYQKFGDRILPGGDLFEQENKWFSVTDSRPENYVTKWLETVRCPVIQIDGTLPVETNVAFLLAALTR